MPLPAALAAAPWGAKAALAGVAALALWQTARRARWSEARPEAAECALDDVADGLALGGSGDAGRDRGDLGEHGPGLAVDLSGLARLRLAALPARAAAHPGRSPRR